MNVEKCAPITLCPNQNDGNVAGIAKMCHFREEIIHRTETGFIF